PDRAARPLRDHRRQGHPRAAGPPAPRLRRAAPHEAARRQRLRALLPAGGLTPGGAPGSLLHVPGATWISAVRPLADKRLSDWPLALLYSGLPPGPRPDAGPPSPARPDGIARATSDSCPAT